MRAVGRLPGPPIGGQVMSEEWCEECQQGTVILDDFQDQIGFEEQARPVRVTLLECGHQIVTPSRWSA